MPRTRAFALVELAILLLTLAVLACLLLVCAPARRGLAWQSGSLANLHEFATVTASYQADNNDLFWAFSWRGGVTTPARYADLRGPWEDALSAGAAQAVDILRWRSGLPFTPISAWIPHILYSHLVLAEYLDRPLPLRFLVSPGDKYRGLWANDIDGFRANAYAPYQPLAGDATTWRWPFSSSYRYPAPFMFPDAATTTTTTVVQIGDWAHFSLVGGAWPLTTINGRRLGEVDFPSQKVLLSDSAQWQGVKRPVFCLMPHARVPVLLVDGSARVRLTGQSNPGFQPGTPRSSSPTTMTYLPNSWDAPNTVQGVNETVTGYHYWSRGGLKARDFDGQEIDTSGW